MTRLSLDEARAKQDNAFALTELYRADQRLPDTGEQTSNSRLNTEKFQRNFGLGSAVQWELELSAC